MTDPTLVLIAALTLGAGLSMYAIFAGADFGGGVWDLFASGERAGEQRRAIARAMGPVWEANHVWVIFLIVVLFTAFPRGFNGLAIGLFLPLSLILLGMILRGAAFVFRAHDEGAPREQHLFGIVFSVSSVVTPFAFGAAAGAIAAGELKPDGDTWTPIPWSAFLQPFPVVVGLLAVCICAYTAATFLTAQTEGALRDDFHRRVMLAGGGVTLFAVIGLVLAREEAPEFSQHLLEGRGLPFVIAAAVLGVAGFVATRAGATRLSRAIAVAFVLAVLWGWAAAQWPYLITPYVTFQDAASSDAMLEVYLVCLAVGALVLVPSLIYLWRTFGGQLPETDPSEP